MIKQIDYSDSKNLIYISTQHIGKEQLEEVENFYFKVLCSVFLEESALLITIQPQDHSFAQGLEKNYNVKMGKNNVLINEIATCTSSLLASISKEEEFSRCLLLLVKSDQVISNDEIAMVLEMVNNKRQSLPTHIKLIYCDDDGNGLYLYNTGLSIEHLRSLST